MSLSVQAKDYIAQHKVETAVGVTLFIGLLAAMIFTHAFTVSPDHLKEGLLSLTAKGMIMNAGITVLVAGTFTLLYYKSKRVQRLFANIKFTTTALKVLAALAIVTYLLPQASFGGNMLIGGVIIGNVLAFTLITAVKEYYKRKHMRSLDDKHHTPEELHGRIFFHEGQEYRVNVTTLEESGSSGEGAAADPEAQSPLHGAGAAPESVQDGTDDLP